jgi:hypothetical protein
MERPPETTPDPPAPATALPTINKVELLATPQTSEPRRKMLKQTRYVDRIEQMLENLPFNGWRAHIVRG